MKRPLLLILLLSVGSGLVWALGPFGDDTPSFTYSRSPFRVLLLVSVADPAAERARAMTLYGDGRMELTLYGAEHKRLELRELQLTRQEIDSLLQIAVESDLTRYDSDVVFRRHESTAPTRVPDSLQATGEITAVQLALESASIEGQELRNVFKRISYPDVHYLSKRYPQISELQGLAALRDQLGQYWPRGRNASSWPATKGRTTFTYSDDPSALVLQVSFPQRVWTRQMDVYGNGRVELFFQGRSPSHRELFLDTDELEQLLRKAVDHGLATYDPTSVRAKKVRASLQGADEHFVTDAETATIRLALKSYRDDAHTETDIEQEIRVYAPKAMAHFFPEIEELQGVQALVEALVLNSGFETGNVSEWSSSCPPSCP